jgi:1-pyrroline-5-carboxylate dehydrogenase
VISFLPSAGRTIGAAINHRDFGGLHFTGSTGTFNQLWQQIGSNLPNYKSYPRIVGETGGKNFHIIHPSANMDHAMYNTIRGAFEYQGQKCSATSRMYVPKSMWEGRGMRDKMVSTIKELKVGQADDPSVFVTAVIDGSAYKDHVGYIEHIKKDPTCKILVGGTYNDKKGWFIDPTLAVTTDPKCRTMQEEIFGPVLTVYVYDDSKPNAWHDICSTANETSPFALTGSIFATDRDALHKATDILRHAAGNLYWNDKSTGAVVGEQPFGGARASGTNDKAGSHLNLLRWVSARTIKENTLPITSYKYPYLTPSK